MDMTSAETYSEKMEQMRKKRQKHFYKCEAGHTMGAPRTQTHCRVCVHGVPCTASLKKLR